MEKGIEDYLMDLYNWGADKLSGRFSKLPEEEREKAKAQLAQFMKENGVRLKASIIADGFNVGGLPLRVAYHVNKRKFKNILEDSSEIGSAEILEGVVDRAEKLFKAASPEAEEVQINLTRTESKGMRIEERINSLFGRQASYQNKFEVYHRVYQLGETIYGLKFEDDAVKTIDALADKYGEANPTLTSIKKWVHRLYTVSEGAEYTKLVAEAVWVFSLFLNSGSFFSPKKVDKSRINVGKDLRKKVGKFINGTTKYSDLAYDSLDLFEGVLEFTPIFTFLTKRAYDEALIAQYRMNQPGYVSNKIYR